MLIEGKAIQLHPLVCAAFNADFDGDQMAVHVPLSLEAQLEARVLMMSTNNILSPANGKPIIVPSQDMVLGLYYLSMDREGEPGEGKILADINEVHQALHVGAVTLHSKITTRVPQTDEQGNEFMRRVDTTPGRMLIGECLPKSHTVPFEVVNRLLTKKEIGDVIDQVYRHTGQKDTVLFADAIMALGFRNAFKAGISLRQGRHDHPRLEGAAGRRDQGAGRRLRAAVPGRLHHPAGKVQQGDRRLEPLRRPGGERHDGRNPRAAEGRERAPEARSTRST